MVGDCLSGESRWLVRLWVSTVSPMGEGGGTKNEQEKIPSLVTIIRSTRLNCLLLLEGFYYCFLQTLVENDKEKTAALDG